MIVKKKKKGLVCSKPCRTENHTQHLFLFARITRLLSIARTQISITPASLLCMLNILQYSFLRYGSEANQQTCLWPGF